MHKRIKAALLALLMVSFIPVTSASAITDANSIQQEYAKTLAEQQATARQRLDDAMLEFCNMAATSMNKIKLFLGDMSEAHIKFIRKSHDAALDYKENKNINFADFNRLEDTAELKYELALAALADYRAVPDLVCNSSGPFADYLLTFTKYLGLIIATFNYLFAVINLYFGIIFAQIQQFMTNLLNETQTSMNKLQSDYLDSIDQIKTGGKQ